MLPEQKLPFITRLAENKILSYQSEWSPQYKSPFCDNKNIEREEDAKFTYRCILGSNSKFGCQNVVKTTERLFFFLAIFNDIISF